MELMMGGWRRARLRGGSQGHHISVDHTGIDHINICCQVTPTLTPDSSYARIMWELLSKSPLPTPEILLADVQGQAACFHSPLEKQGLMRREGILLRLSPLLCTIRKSLGFLREWSILVYQVTLIKSSFSGANLNVRSSPQQGNDQSWYHLKIFFFSKTLFHLTLPFPLLVSWPSFRFCTSRLPFSLSKLKETGKCLGSFDTGGIKYSCQSEAASARHNQPPKFRRVV